MNFPGPTDFRAQAGPKKMLKKSVPLNTSGQAGWLIFRPEKFSGQPDPARNRGKARRPTGRAGPARSFDRPRRKKLRKGKPYYPRSLSTARNLLLLSLSSETRRLRLLFSLSPPLSSSCATRRSEPPPVRPIPCTSPPTAEEQAADAPRLHCSSSSSAVHRRPPPHNPITNKSWEVTRFTMFATAIRYIGKKPKPKMKPIELKTPPEQAQTITRVIFNVLKEHGPLTIADTWEHVKDVGLRGLSSKRHMKIVMRWMRERQKLRLICNHVGPTKQFLYTTWFTKPDIKPMRPGTPEIKPVRPRTDDATRPKS